MSNQPRTRQELYERIAQTSKDEVILEEMIRLGFWPRASLIPDNPADEIRRKGEILRELKALQTESWRLRDEKALRKEALKRRMEAARKRRQETRDRNVAKAAAKASAWKEKKQRDLVYLGPGVSFLLSGQESKLELLAQTGLPPIKTVAELATAMKVSVGGLRFLAWNREVSKTSHYIRFRIPKKTGGERLISAPKPDLKRAQHWILENILEKLPTHPAAYGFVAGRSIVDNASSHLGRDVVVNLDLEGFFPSVSWRRVRGLFKNLGFSNQLSSLLALLCSEPETVEIEVDNTRWFVALSERRLPQGSPASPAITNLLCRRLDARLAGLAESLGFLYTRYADDLSFSADGEGASKVGKLLKDVVFIVQQEGFKVHPDKTRIQRKGSRQEVTGLVVNEKVGVPRDSLRKFRALLHRIDTKGPEGCRWGGGELFSSILGFAGFVAMVDPDKGKGLVEKVDALAARWKPKVERAAEPVVEIEKPAPELEKPVGEKPVLEAEKPAEPPKEWWKLF